MRNIDRFILHVVHNWPTKLNEAIGKAQMDGLINKFKKDAEDFNIEITDEQLKKYIEVFDRVKEKLPGDQRDIGKWSLSKLIKLATGVKGSEADDVEEIDITPDVVYNNDDNTIVIYNGSKEGNCITYGKGEKWCITRGSFGSYRYSQSRNYPTFYLARNSNLSTDDKLSFVAIQVRDPNNYRDGKNYVFTNRKNSPYESEEMSFEELLRKVPWLQDIPNLKSVLKYIPLSTKEKVGSQYKYSTISYNEWTKLPYKIKEQYLVVRRSNDNLFSDVTAEKFVEKYLPKYPEIANFIAVSTPAEDENPIIKYSYLLQNLDKFSSPIQKSIVANIRQKIDPVYLSSIDFPFEQKKRMVERNLWNTSDRMYVTKDGSTIVRLNLRGNEDIEMSLYQEDDSYPRVKLNQRTSKYLREYPELDKIPLNVLLKLVENNILGAEFVGDVLKRAKEDPNSALIFKEMEDGSEIILDSNAFSSYKIEGGTIKKIPFTDEEVQQVFADAKDNEAFQQNALNLFKDINSIPSSIDVNSLKGVINSIPYNQRIITTRNNPTMPVVLLTADGDEEYFFTSPSSVSGPFYRVTSQYNRNGRAAGYGNMTPAKIPAYHAYLRSINKSFDDQDLQNILGNNGIDFEGKVAAARDGIPVNADNVYKVVYNNDTGLVMLINSENSRNSLTLSRARNNLKQFNIPQGAADIYLGRTPAQAPGQAAAQANAAVRARRGRPAGTTNTPRPQQAAEPAAGEERLSTVADGLGLTRALATIPPRSLRNFPANVRQVPVGNNRAASRRQNIIGYGRGRVIRAYEGGNADIFIIRLTNGTNVMSAVVPNNSHWLITSNGAYQLDSVSDLLRALQQRGLAEVHQYIVNEYLDRNPNHLNEFKKLLRQHINEKKKRNEQK